MREEEEKKRDSKQRTRETVCWGLMITEPLLITLVGLNVLVCRVINRSQTHTDLNTSRILRIITNYMHMMLHTIELIVQICSSDPLTPCYRQMNCEIRLPQVPHRYLTVCSFSTAM